jgi:hypothetical protein
VDPGGWLLEKEGFAGVAEREWEGGGKGEEGEVGEEVGEGWHFENS